jgi:peptidoglycan hydrolase CwlO-like protein
MNKILLVFLLVLMGCSKNSTYETVSNEDVDSTYVKSSDSLDEMMAYIKYIDSAGVVEQVSDNFTELKETNEQLETTLEETKQELATTKEELTETKTTLQKAEQIVKAITGDSSTNASSFELLPIKK